MLIIISIIFICSFLPVNLWNGIQYFSLQLTLLYWSVSVGFLFSHNCVHTSCKQTGIKMMSVIQAKKRIRNKSSQRYSVKFPCEEYSPRSPEVSYKIMSVVFQGTK